MRRYTSRKLRGGAKGTVRHAIIDYDVAGPAAPGNALPEGHDSFVGDIAAISRLSKEVVSAITSLDRELAAQG